MSARNPTQTTAVSPLELFFDLVFVFAVSRLSRHVLEHLHWRGVAEAGVLLVGVFVVWAYTSFDATLTCVRRSTTQWMLLAVMAAALFMNVSLAHAFEDGPWSFVLSMLAIQFGRTLLSTIPAVPGRLKGHYLRAMTWWLAATPLWIAGALSAPGARLGWWAIAVLGELVGLWLAHPLPGHWLRSEAMTFDAEHMIERLRLFLIIALGEVVLAIGTTLATQPRHWTTLGLGGCALLVVVALWAVYFGASDRWVSRHVEGTGNPMRTARLGMFAECLGVAGLIAIAVANETAIAHPQGPTSAVLASLMFGGALLYLAADTWYLRIATGAWSRLRVGFLGALLVSVFLARALRVGAALVLLAIELAALALALRTGDAHVPGARGAGPTRS